MWEGGERLWMCVGGGIGRCEKGLGRRCSEGVCMWEEGERLGYVWKGGERLWMCVGGGYREM